MAGDAEQPADRGTQRRVEARRSLQRGRKVSAVRSAATSGSPVRRMKKARTSSTSWRYHDANRSGSSGVERSQDSSERMVNPPLPQRASRVTAGTARQRGV
jgi:hypothetical protein